MISIKSICKISIAWIVLATVVVFIPNISPWIATPFVLAGIILIPGLLLAINIGIRRDTISGYLPYSIGLGLGFVLIGSLIINWLFPLIGIAEPLAKLPLMLFFDGSILILAGCAYLFNRTIAIPYSARIPDSKNLIFGTLPLLFIVMSVIGAERLNNGESGTITLIMLFSIAFYFLILACWGRSSKEWVYVSALYCTALSLLLMYSLRSSHILGWDINQEYQVFQATLQHLVWKTSYYPNFDYNACLSITILPTIFKVLTNISSEYVFKVTFQLLFATTPVLLYILARRYLTESLAFMAAFLFISQEWFYEQMPALIRQETAFIFYILILIVLFDTQLSKRTRYILLSVFTVALALSHYSTAYVWITVMLGWLILSYAIRFFIKPLRGRKPLVSPVLLAVTLVILAIWEIPITHTGTAISKFTTNQNPATTTKRSPVGVSSVINPNNDQADTNSDIQRKDISLASVEGLMQNFIRQILFVTIDPNNQGNLLTANQKAITTYANTAKYNIYPDSADSTYEPRIISDSINLTSRTAAPLASLIGFLSQASKILLIDLFPIIGIISLCVSLYRRPSEDTYNLILLNISAFGLIALTVLIPYLQDYYNLTRLYLQMFFVLSILSIIGGVTITKRIPRFQTVLLASMLAVLFCSLSGAFGQIMGGQARVTLDQPPGNLDIYYTYDSEAAGAKWLSENRNPTSPIQADVIAGLRLQSFGNIAASNSAIFPQTLEQNSYVYLIGLNTHSGKAFYQSQNNLLIYNYPSDFLSGHKDLIYNSGNSRVYR